MSLCVLVTRFNLPSRGNEQLVRAQQDWLVRRWALFERYCAPSVAAQSVPGFRWIVYLDEESPDWLREGIGRYAERGMLDALYRLEVGSGDLAADIDALYHPAAEDIVVTANLDNDDAIAPDFVQRLCGVRTTKSRCAIYLDTGLIRQDGRLYLHHDPQNAFCAVRERWSAPATCWADWHNRLGEHMPVQVETGSPAWLQVVHGQNVSNRVRGRRAQPGRFTALFPGLLNDLLEPTARELALDRLVKAPLRRGKLSIRTRARFVLLALLGKERTDAAKQAVTRLKLSVARSR